MKKTKNSKKRTPPTPDQLLKREKSTFKRKIRNIFTGAGFDYVPINDEEMSIGLRKIEVDSLFIFENIWLICEDTVATTNIRDHIWTKNEAFGKILKNPEEFRKKLIEMFPNKSELLAKYDMNRLKFFGLYISKNDLSLNDEDYDLYSNLKFVHIQTLDYFQWIVKAIKISGCNEIFRFLGLKTDQIGLKSSSSDSTQIVAPIIYPREFTGIKNGVRIVSFMMSAEDLLNTSYVLRKDNWEE